MQREQKLIMALMTLFMLTSFKISAASIKMGRFPAPSPDGKTLAFTYQGDLWRVSINGGRAERLTVHEAYDSHPLWSPDGKEIAFSSDRFGNDDIFVIPADGGSPERITYFSNSDQMCDWSADGKMLYFTSLRDFYYNRMPVMYQVKRKDGGTPVKTLAAYVDHGKISPDGQWLVYARGREAWTRKHYRGSTNCDIWLYNFKTKDFRRLTNFNGNDWRPLWSADGKTIYFVSDRGPANTFNLWQMDLSGENKKQLTFHKDDGVRFPSISQNGQVISYSRGADIWVYSVLNGKTTPVEIFAPSDHKVNLVESKTFTDKATELAVAPDEKKIAFVVHGEIFLSTFKKDGKTGRTIRLTDTPARERDIFWAPNSDTLLYASDRNGNDDIFMLYPAEGEENDLTKALTFQETCLVSSPQSETVPRFSPDGKKISYIRGKGDLHVMDIDGKNDKAIITGWSTPDYAWSPDSKWIAYSRDDNDFNSDVFIIPAGGGQAINVTMHPDNDMSPVWSKDGRKLGFISRRIANTQDVWFVFLQKKDDEKTKEDWEAEEESTKNKEEKDKTVKDTLVVKIDFENINKRLRRVTALPGDEGNLAISPNGKTFVFTSNADGKQDLYKIKWDTSEMKRLTSSNLSPSFVTFSNDGKKIYLLSKGTLHSLSSEGKDQTTLAFKAKMDINHGAERAQKFNEAWMTLNERFYDPHFHGVDWKAMKKKYAPLAEQATTIRGFNDVIRFMLGELNSSHLGIGGPSEGPHVSTGMLGLRFDESYDGKGLKVASVLPKGPCDEEESRVMPGSILLSVDDTPITASTNIHKLLNDKVGEKVRIKVQSPDKTIQKFIVRPINYGTFSNLEYDRWVNAKRALVDKESKGKLGYVHIRGMGMSNAEQFEGELYSVAHGKDGLIIDVRNNGGGWITDYLLAMLVVRPHAYTIPRDGGKGYPQDRLPLYYWSNPIVTLCNEWSFSNAEIFPHAIKGLKRGKVVGAPTGGLVISTGAISLIDGSSFRVPFRGWYAIYSGLEEEGHGCIPDVVIWDEPGDAAKGVDRQLAKSVQVLSSEIK